MKYAASIKFVEELVREVPELQAIYDKHIADYEEVLPHVFFGEVTPFVISATSREGNRDMLVRLLDKCELGLAEKNDEISNVIALSFVEGLYGQSAALQVLKPLMGENLKTELKNMCGE